jgi:type II secretory pathway pseudopilin PulG
MRNTQGLSLIEVLVSFSVVSIVFLALAMSQVFGFRTTRDSLEASTARDLASEQIEIIRSYGYISYQDCPSTSPSGASANFSDGFPSCSGSDDSIDNFPGYTLAWAIALPDDVPVTDPPFLLDVEVTVQRDDLIYVLASYLSCADAGDLSVTNIPCPEDDNGLLP